MEEEKLCRVKRAYCGCLVVGLAMVAMGGLLKLLFWLLLSS